MTPDLYILAGFTAGALLTAGLCRGLLELAAKFLTMAVNETKRAERAASRPLVWIEHKRARVRSEATAGVVVRV